jgi:WD40 repeat protein
MVEWWLLPDLTLLRQSRVRSKIIPFSKEKESNFYSALGALTFTPDGRLIGGAGGVFLALPEKEEAISEWCEEVWDVDTFGISFHPDQKQFAVELAGESSTAIRFGELTATLEVWENRLLKRQANTLSQLAFSPDGKYFAFGDWDLHLYSYPDLERIYSFKPTGERFEKEEYQGYVRVIWSPPVFLPNTPILICGSPQGVLFAWDITSGEIVHQVQAHEGEINSLVFDEHSQRLISAGADKQVKVWQVTL